MCPSYWLTEAYTSRGRVGYKYQHSIIGAEHASDIVGFFGPPTPNQSRAWSEQLRVRPRPLSFNLSPSLSNFGVAAIWGNFITTSNPSISAAVASGSNATSNNSARSAATDFPPFSLAQPYQLDVNETGAVPYSSMSYSPLAPNITRFEEPGLQNSFRLVNAYTWEGGRGTRCDFWRSVASIVPE